MGQKVDALIARTKQISYLRSVVGVLEWDQQVNMPPGGGPARAASIGLVSRIAHEQFTDADTGRLLEAAEREVEGSDPESDAVRLVGNVRHDFDRAVKIPATLAGEIAEHSVTAEGIWREARSQSEFSAFAPALEKMVVLIRQVAERLGYTDDVYDPLLDGFEPGMRTAEVAAVFAELRPQLVDLTRTIGEARSPDGAPISGRFDIPTQRELTKEVVAAIGYDLTRGRQDEAAHPFCTDFSRGDVRITTRFSADRLDAALYASMHEAGHAMYEQGIPMEWDHTPLGSAASMGVHESQSRMWENLVGRGRPFCEYVMPKLQATFPDAYAGVDVERYYRAVNRVERSFIRVEADEVTYNLHILLRFELERELLQGKLSVRDLPGAWNARMHQYLGITPPDDAHGVLQDIHWSGGMFGYFPTYTLGNLISAQLWHAAQRDLPDLDDRIRAGEFTSLLGWLREHVHRCGRKYRPDELIQKATGEPLTARYYVDYLHTKFGELYGVQ